MGLSLPTVCKLILPFTFSSASPQWLTFLQFCSKRIKMILNPQIKRDQWACIGQGLVARWNDGILLRIFYPKWSAFSIKLPTLSLKVQSSPFSISFSGLAKETLGLEQIGLENIIPGKATDNFISVSSYSGSGRHLLPFPLELERHSRLWWAVGGSCLGLVGVSPLQALHSLFLSHSDLHALWINWFFLQWTFV